MKTYILTTILTARESYGEYVYAVFANSFAEAYEKIKVDEDLSFSNFRDYKKEQHYVSFVAIAHELYSCDCVLSELQESDKIVCLGGYVE
jgi:hypothetical protein